MVTRFYRSSNARLTVQGDCWRMRVLAFVGWVLRIQFHVDGLPFGGKYRRRSEGQRGQWQRTRHGALSTWLD